jgi:hypothetical protein
MAVIRSNLGMKGELRMKVTRSRPTLRRRVLDAIAALFRGAV